MSGPRVFVLLAFDPATGAATSPVGALGVAGDTSYASFVPYAAGADLWRERLAAAAARPRATVAYWLDRTDEVTWALQELQVPAGASDLRGAVERVVDVMLWPAGGQVELGSAAAGS